MTLAPHADIAAQHNTLHQPIFIAACYCYGRQDQSKNAFPLFKRCIFILVFFFGLIGVNTG
ncbi:hypothetical protein PEC301296_17840 [Pectobacterium carotovorum subsp. carotovorum]|uniref:Uncharacterized protein n=1 Tax=Pectobacterium peruviense TaxID=2066479 RepID=A0ABX4S1X0_9GAMM|nr:hypothetical protein EV46_03950 [Pectobacterium atrosepticum]KML69030.1 hypothetical protein G033_04350 [Pectobacterium peruviense]GKV85472.1 hypothetical protein PEC301296_17840 [Pectobacterium carotovorum subsp. carotovorum]ATY89675.1 hypothetical protein CVS35_04525 [Pectobacterium atrosepticum]KFX22703.1 hypothetical protein KP24_19400 [Pectobacterium atrosepticum]